MPRSLKESILSFSSVQRVAFLVGVVPTSYIDGGGAGLGQSSTDHLLLLHTLFYTIFHTLFFYGHSHL